MKFNPADIADLVSHAVMDSVIEAELLTCKDVYDFEEPCETAVFTGKAKYLETALDIESQLRGSHPFGWKIRIPNQRGRS